MGREIHGVEVRPLTRKQVRELKPNGFRLSYYTGEAETPELLDEGYEKVIKWGVVNMEAYEALEGEPLQKSSQVFFAIVAETYGARGEEKNLPTSGNGTQTEPD